MRKFEFLDHQADLAFRVRGETLEELFENAASALAAAAEAEPSGPCRKARGKCSLRAASPEELLVAFLNELRYRLAVKNLLFENILITIGHQKWLELRASAKVVPCRTRREIKSVTHHGLRITRRGRLLTARAVLDV